MRKSINLAICLMLTACSQTPLDRLNNGYDAFLETSDASLYKKLANDQKPHTLVISCADSRVVPEFIFSAKAGDLFSVRLPSPETDVNATVEYALDVLKIKNIVILEHSDCSGLQDKAIEARGVKRLNALKAIPLLQRVATEDDGISVSLMMFDIKTRTLKSYDAANGKWKKL